MKTKPTQFNCNTPPIPDALHKAYKILASAAWELAQRIANEKAMNDWREKTAALEKEVKELKIFSASQAEAILALGAKLEASEAGAAEATSVARHKAEEGERELAKVTERAKFASGYANRIELQAEKLKIALRAAHLSAQALFAEIEDGVKCRAEYVIAETIP